MRIGAGRTAAAPTIFPLSISSNGRYLQDARGLPFFLFGDTPWSIENQLTRPQIDWYLSVRKQQGINAIQFEFCEHKFSSQSPAYRNVNGDDPFTTMSPTDFSTVNEPYLSNVEYIINRCYDFGIVCLITPLYLGFGGGTEGWTSEMTADTAGHLQTFGTTLRNRCNKGNVIWIAGGDYPGTQTERDKQANVFASIKAVGASDLFTGHPARSDGEAQPFWGGYPWFNLNSIYVASDGTDAYSKAATAYGRTLPFFMIEAGYEGERTVAEARRAMLQSAFSGATGLMNGNNPIWGFGESNANGGLGAQSALSTSLNTTLFQQVTYLRDLLTSYSWHTMVPKTDTSLVTTSLGTGSGRVCPMLGSSFAMIYSPAVNATVAMSNFPQSSVRGRLWDPTTGTFTDASGTPFANSGTHSFTIASESVLVLD